MRAVIQRVTGAHLMVNGKPAGKIGTGMVVLVGMETGDTQEDADWLCGKIARLRIFNDPEGVMNLPVTEAGGDTMVVSQFTLHASTRKGNRPSYIRAARPEQAIPLYDAFLNRISEETGKPVVSGTFGANMQIMLTNDGPVTIWIDTKNRE